MAEVPDSSNFYSSLHTMRSRREIAGLFGAAGWEVREPDDWDHLEVHCPWAELVIESASPILMHGPVADVEANAERVLAVLTGAGVAFTAECYGPDDELLREWRAGIA
jgi:hypothetical protein